MDTDSAPTEEAISDAQPQPAMHAAPQAPTIERSLVLRSHAGLEPSQSTRTAGVQLADQVLSPPSVEDLCKHITTQVIRSLAENGCINLAAPTTDKESFIQDLCNRTCTRVIRSFSGKDTLQPTLKKKKRKKSFHLEQTARGQSELGGNELDWPEDLVERILCRIPFPSIFQARILSRSWSVKFPFQQPPNCYFQNLVSSVSSSWTTYCPVYLTSVTMVCFDQASSRWKSILPVSYFPEFEDECMHSDIVIAGPLVCLFHSCQQGQKMVVVTNVITKSWKKLPYLPERGIRPRDMEPSHIRIVQAGFRMDSYRVIIVYLSLGETHIYNSSLRSWTMVPFPPLRGGILTFCENSAYLDGKLYCLHVKRNEISRTVALLTLWTFLVERESWVPVPPRPFPSRCPDLIDCALLVCKDKVLIAIWFWNSETPESLINTIEIYEVSLSTGISFTKVCIGPPASNIVLHGHKPFDHEPNHGCYEMKFASDANLLYFEVTHTNASDQWVLACDVERERWSLLPHIPRSHPRFNRKWLGNAFQPGSNPFALV